MILKFNTFKKHYKLIILALLLGALTIYSRQPFYIILLFYGLLIKLLLSKFIDGKLRKVSAVVIWSAFLTVLGLGFYVNHYLPHGPSYSTGEFVCQNDERGPCSEQYQEDLRNVNIPNWAKFLRESGGKLLLLGLLFAGVVISGKEKVAV